MQRLLMLRIVATGVVVASAVSLAGGQPASRAARVARQFAGSQIQTVNGQPAEIDLFFLDRDCATCHPRQMRELHGSMHSAAHQEPLYRKFAELARAEAGAATYTGCSGCHSPAGVVTGMIPATGDDDLPAEAKAGVTCQVCHQIARLTGNHGRWGEPGNASIAIDQGQAMYGPSGKVADNRRHTGEKRDFFTKSEFCASCHTVIHPTNGLRIEHTYGEWKASVYAAKGIQCQDCHMRTVADALRVAETLRPVVVRGPSAKGGATRDIALHFFVGGNTNADRLAGGTMHARMAEERLQGAAAIRVEAPAKVSPGSVVPLRLIVENVAAGHNLPTGVTELRQMWVELRITDAGGKVIFRHGGLDARGNLRPESIWFGAIAADRHGKATYRPWEMARFLRTNTIPPKGSAAARVTAKLPGHIRGPLTIKATLFYRSAPPHVVAEVLQEDAFVPKVVNMTSTKSTLSIE